MKTRIWLLCIAALVLLLLLRPAAHNHSPSPPSTGAASQAAVEQPPDPGRAVGPPGTTPTTIPPTATPSPTGEWGSNSARQASLTRWQAPIDFYGKVVDESNNPVQGAAIHLRWIETPFTGGERTADTQSDPEGLFALQGKHGRSLTVWFAKEGYYSSHNGQRGFLYALGPEIHSPDPRNPVVFILRKKGQGAHLVTSGNGLRPNLAIRVPKNGTPIRVDLLQKQPSASGQLEIAQNKPPWNEAAEWSFRVSIPGGGFVESQDEFPFEAPESNYVSDLEYRFTKEGTNWTTHATKQFYVAFGEPRRFGWLRIESDLAQETVFLTYAINPSGSRNLEPAN